MPLVERHTFAMGRDRWEETSPHGEPILTAAGERSEVPLLPKAAVGQPSDKLPCVEPRRLCPWRRHLGPQWALHKCKLRRAPGHPASRVSGPSGGFICHQMSFRKFFFYLKYLVMILLFATQYLNWWADIWPWTHHSSLWPWITLAKKWELNYLQSAVQL